MIGIASLALAGWVIAQAPQASSTTVDDMGAITRGPRDARRIALVFTGHEFAEGFTTILDACARRSAKASFFLTGDFLRREAFAPFMTRAVREGHFVGPHSDRHLLYAGWEASRPTLVSRDAFRRDVRDNLEALRTFGIDATSVRYWLPAYEWYNRDIVTWAGELGLKTLDFTRGTRANADYMRDDDPKFVSTDRIVESIVERERGDDAGLNGFILLMHVGAGPGRSVPLHTRIEHLLETLGARGYAFVRVDELLASR